MKLIRKGRQRTPGEPIVKPTAPSWLYIDHLHGDSYRMDRYWDRLESLPVPTPTTEIIRLSDGNGDLPPCPTEAVQSFMDERNLDRAFVRSGHKAAPLRIHDGSIVQDASAEAIERTVRDLLAQHVNQDIPHGNVLVVRELLDLRFCMKRHVMCHPEVRYFIEGGEVLSRTPDPFRASGHVCAAQYDYLREQLVDASPPDEYAEIVAEEFDGATWSVDFVMDTRGDWYATEMHLNGVYWNEFEDCWWNIVGQGQVEPWSPLWIHGTALPDLS